MFHDAMPDPNAPVRAAVLAATLAAEPRPVDPFEMRIPAIRRIMPRVTPPLDLDAPIHRYFVHADGSATVRRDRVGARSCGSGHMRHR